MKKIFLVLLSLYIPLSGFAYNTSNHEAITQQAIYLLNASYCCDFITPDEAKMIIKGNVSEDKNVFKWPARIFNQHFYNPLKESKFRKRIHSINVRFERIAKRFFKRINSKKYFRSVGEIIHHIQDATNPSHVVPVYHGFNVKDKFDEHYLACYFPKRVEIDTMKCYYSTYLPAMLNPVAERTLEAIKQNFEIDVMHKEVFVKRLINWSAYWNDNPKDWFGQYGYIGKPDKCAGENIDNYFVSKIIKGDTTYYINRCIYDDFSRKQTEMAVIETAQFLFYAKRMYGLHHPNQKSLCIPTDAGRIIVFEAI